jgi:hypothetical protein
VLYTNRPITVSAPLHLGLRLLPIAAGAFGALFCAYAVVSPDERLLKLVYLSIALSVAIALPAHVFIAASVLAFAVSTASRAPVLASLPVAVYISDLLVVLIAIRGVLPRDRVPSNRALAGAPGLLFALWAVVMTIAAVRGMNAGVSLASAIRGEVALVYWPLLYFGFTRVLRERELNTSLLWRNLAYVALGLAGWMFLARALNHPFEDPGLGVVPTGEGEVVFRNFGFAAAFIVYPALALVGIAGMAHGGGRRSRWAVLATVGTIATLTTLVRGEIFALAVGALLILWLRPRSVGTSARARTAVQLGLASVTAVAGLIAVNPDLGNAIVQRAIPFTHQAERAEATAEYRQKAVDTGIRLARSHPIGLGVLDPDRLDAHHIDRGYLAHSGVATLLLIGGWPALVSALLVILSLLRRSARFATATPWLHPAFVGVLTMLSIYSVGAAGLAGDAWVIPLGALAVALRFNLPASQEPAQT